MCASVKRDKMLINYFYSSSVLSNCQKKIYQSYKTMIEILESRGKF